MKIFRRIKNQWSAFRKNWLENLGLGVVFILILTGSVNILVGLLLAVSYQVTLEIIRKKVIKWKARLVKNT